MEITNSTPCLFAIDLFAGGGGLTVGLKKAGFSVVSAVEIESNACATYVANHPRTNLISEDICQITGQHLRQTSPEGRIDLLAGCPPCQGFTSLTNKYKRKDPRNDLVLEMLRLIQEVHPQAIMMENVAGLMTRGKPLFSNFIKTIESLGYIPNYDVLQVADYGVPQYRRRLVLVAGLGFEIPLPNPTHSRTGKNGCELWMSVRDTIGGMPHPINLTEAQKRGKPKDVNWHVVRTLSPINQLRLKHASPSKTWKEIPEKLRPKCHQGGYTGFANVYGRMSWNNVSPTITGGCTTFSKGRFGHPSQNRTISVREAALLQTFPENYVFDTPYMEHVCNTIGNALPCTFAKAIAKECFREIYSRKN